MDSLKFLFGMAVLLLCIGLIGSVIWVLLFGIPKGAMEGGTLVQGCLETLGRGRVL